MKIYLIGSLRNPVIPKIGNLLRAEGYDVFDDWFAAGPEADDYWRKYERGRGRTVAEAVRGLAAGHLFDFDIEHLRSADVGILVLPTGRSGHLELGVLVGLGKRTYILLDKEPERFDVMYRFTDGIFSSLPELIAELKCL